MPGRRGWSHERRENLAELDAGLRDRLLSLDEPVDRSDWPAVVKRSRGARLSRYGAFALVASGVAVLSLALTSALVQRFPGGGHPSRETAPLQLTLLLSGGSGLVLYSDAKRARFLDNSDDRISGRTTPADPGTAAIVQSLSGGPFHLIHAASATRPVSDGPLPGDQALVSFNVFTTAELQRTVGSAVLTCRYAFDGNAYCDGALDLEDGVRLTATGTLNAAADHFTLAVTSGQGRGVLTAAPANRGLGDLN